MKVAETFEEKTDHMLSQEIVRNEYLNKFADKMMLLSNRLSEIDDNESWSDDIDIKDDYLPAIQEFILNINGL